MTSDLSPSVVVVSLLAIVAITFGYSGFRALRIGGRVGVMLACVALTLFVAAAIFAILVSTSLL